MLQRFASSQNPYRFSIRATDKGNVGEDLSDLFDKEDLRDIEVQEELMEDYLKDYEVNDEILEKVFKLNKKYNKLAEEDEDVSRNINWKLKKLSWSNLFNYGEDNVIDFEKLRGTVGIFGKNYSVKVQSSIRCFLQFLTRLLKTSAKMLMSLIKISKRPMVWLR